MPSDLNQFKLLLGKRIKFLRERRALTQPELGALVNVDFQSISRIENGKTNPSAYLVKQIADALQVDMNEIYNL